MVNRQIPQADTGRYYIHRGGQGQITIAKALTEHIPFKHGDKILITRKGHGISIEALNG